MNAKDLAVAIIENVGGKGNVKDVMHCATRLRLVLKREELAQEEVIEKLDGVNAVITAAGQLQIIIGPDVVKVYRIVTELVGIEEKPEIEAEADREESGKTVPAGAEQARSESDNARAVKKQGIINRIMGYVSAAITPLILPLLGSSIIKVLLTILLQYNVLTYTDGTYAVLSAASNAVFTFLPVLVSITCARYLKCNPWIAACIGGALMEPTLTALTDTTISFIGIPIRMFNYTSTVFPAMVAIGLYAVVEHYLDRKIQREIVKTFVLPTVGLLVFVPLTLALFGPFSYYLGEGILWLYHTFYEFSPVLMGVLFGATFWFSVAFGLHWALVPIVVADLASGSCPLAGVYICGNIAMWGSTLGMVWASKTQKQRAEYITHFLTVCVAGVTEPYLYGTVLKSKRMIASIALGGAIGGGLMAIIHNAGLAYTYTNIFTVPTLWVNDNYVLYLLFVLITVAVGMLATRFWASKEILTDGQ